MKHFRNAAPLWFVAMCIGLDSGVLVPVAALLAALTLTTVFNIRRLVEALRGVSDERSWFEAVEDCGPHLLTNAIWIVVAYLAARSCGFFG